MYVCVRPMYRYPQYTDHTVLKNKHSRSQVWWCKGKGRIARALSCSRTMHAYTRWMYPTEWLTVVPLSASLLANIEEQIDMKQAKISSLAPAYLQYKSVETPSVLVPAKVSAKYRSRFGTCSDVAVPRFVVSEWPAPLPTPRRPDNTNKRFLIIGRRTTTSQS